MLENVYEIVKFLTSAENGCCFEQYVYWFERKIFRHNAVIPDFGILVFPSDSISVFELKSISNSTTVMVENS